MVSVLPKQSQQPPLPRVVFADRALVNNVGGNSTYLRALYRGLSAAGLTYEPAGIGTAMGLRGAVLEASMVRRHKTANVFHYPTDTGGLMRPPAHRRVVATIHGVASRHIPAVRSSSAERLWRWRVGRTARISDLVITVSQTSAADIQAVFGVDAERIRIIPHGIDHDRFRPDVDTSILHRYEQLPDAYYLYVGNLDPRKNVRALIEAFRSEKLAALGLQLVIAGRAAWGVSGLTQLIDESPNVVWLGQVPDEVVAPLMVGATAFVFPSAYEGFGFPVLEAAACGTLVLTTRKGSLADIADGLSVDLGEPTVDNIAGCVELVEHLSSSDRETMISAARAKAKTFSWAKSVAMHRDVFEALR